eukprot:3585882-Amphidinium_carterae.1
MENHAYSPASAVAAQKYTLHQAHRCGQLNSGQLWRGIELIAHVSKPPRCGLKCFGSHQCNNSNPRTPMWP